MLVLLVARSVGNSFNEGIYDTQIGIKKMPFLEQEPPEETKARNLRANQLMSKEVLCDDRPPDQPFKRDMPVP